MFKTAAKQGWKYFFVSMLLMVGGASLMLLGAAFDTIMGIEQAGVGEMSAMAQIVGFLGILFFIWGNFRYCAQGVGKLLMFFRGSP